MKQKKTCSNCLRGISIPVNDDILCREKGAVARDYTCPRHKLNIDPRTNRNPVCKCLQCDNFIIDASCPSGTTSVGICRMFSVRQFDGEARNACSKFVKKSQTDAS